MSASTFPTTYAEPAAQFFRWLTNHAEVISPCTTYLEAPDIVAVIPHQKPLTAGQSEFFYDILADLGLGLSSTDLPMPPPERILADQPDQISDMLKESITALIQHTGSNQASLYSRHALLIGMTDGSVLPGVIVIAMNDPDCPQSVALQLAFPLTTKEFDTDDLATQAGYAAAFLSLLTRPVDVIFNGDTLELVAPGTSAEALMEQYHTKLADTQEVVESCYAMSLQGEARSEEPSTEGRGFRPAMPFPGTSLNFPIERSGTTEGTTE